MAERPQRGRKTQNLKTAIQLQMAEREKGGIRNGDISRVSSLPQEAEGKE